MAKEEIQYVWSDKKRTLFGLPLSFTRYFLTETKFITRRGLLSLEEDELELYKVVDKKMQLSFWQRIFGCGGGKRTEHHYKGSGSGNRNGNHYRKPIPDRQLYGG